MRVFLTRSTLVPGLHVFRSPKEISRFEIIAYLFMRVLNLFHSDDCLSLY